MIEIWVAFPRNHCYRVPDIRSYSLAFVTELFTRSIFEAMEAREGSLKKCPNYMIMIHRPKHIVVTVAPQDSPSKKERSGRMR